ncbi:MAG TPA: 4-alpha-glucanotransferase [Opitutaceae bacterium]|nr:4-alpha-glucanotransferase [Opitutaceae bacterium]
MSQINSHGKHAGLLVPVFALRHGDDFGIGDTQAVRDAIDFCATTKFSVLQILPIHETVGDHSPYNAISSRALSPAYIYLSPAEVPGLSQEMIEDHASTEWRAQLRKGSVKHGVVHKLKIEILRSAYQAFCESPEDFPLCSEFARFQEEQKHWLKAYTLFRVLTHHYDENPNWLEWRPEHRTIASAENWLSNQPEKKKLNDWRETFAFIQWVAWRQWRGLREYASESRIQLMGEMSFGLSLSSADTWAEPELFDFEWHVGTRPISYFDTNKDSERWGQNWGLPAYHWENHRKNGFKWLRSRIQGELQFFHICRLDHLRGYFRAYVFPWAGGVVHSEFATLTVEEAMERTGGRLPRFFPGPDDDVDAAKLNENQGRELIGVIKDAAEAMSLVGEIMGHIPDYMRSVIDDLQIANLTFPQLERNHDRSLQSPNSYRPLSLATYANHDHAPLAAYYHHLKENAARDTSGKLTEELASLLHFLGWNKEPPAELSDELLATLVRFLFKTPCYLTVLMSSDLLGIPQRFNLPGSYGTGTWSERLDHPLSGYLQNEPWRGRIQRVNELILETGRSR